ncbi:hypothetical protein MSEO_40320 [Mycobacterium seoulense]|uniref:Uncharacterized protein n=1 Tax=Mycobacterium seoulense TaxID=386911 RepID=A0A7I7P3R6_9MYCO|nr:hypothetical protein MSEO_40320 [Mycobacterium seoulense]
MLDEFAPACPAAAPGAPRSTGETRGPPADGDDPGDGATGAPETGAVGAAGMAGGAATDGRRSEPYAGSDPAGIFGLPLTGAADPDQDPPVITGATGAVPPVAGGAEAAGGGASTGVLVGMKTPALGAVGVTGGVPAGGPVSGGAPPPDSIACIAPDDNPWAPAPAGCPVAIPDANDCARLGEAPCPRPAGDIPPAP